MKENGIVFLEDGYVPFKWRNRKGETLTFNLYFSLNAMDAIQKKFKSVYKLNEVMTPDNPKSIEDTKWIFTLLINEGRDDDEPEYSEEFVGKMVNARNMDTITSLIYEAFVNGDDPADLTTDGSSEKSDDEETADDDDEEDDRQGTS